MKAVSLLAFVFVVSLAHADWPRLRGANGDGVADKASKVPVTWSDTEHVAWKANLPGPGSSSPIIVSDKVFVTCWSGYGDAGGGTIEQLKRHLICLSKKDGKILWDKSVPAVQPEDPFQGMLTEHGYASSTPASDGQSVFVFFGKSGALGFDLDGNQLWQTSLGTNSNRKGWGSGASPVVYKDTVIITALDEGGTISALDKKTGKQVWKAAADGLEVVFCTPVVRANSGVDELLINVPMELWALNAATGKMRWYAEHGLPGNVSTGVAVGPEALYVTGGFPTQGTVAIKPGTKGDVTKTNILWSVNTASYVPSPVYHDGYLYVINDQGFAICVDAKTGKEIYRERAIESGGGRGRGKPFYASPVLVDGKLYCPSRRGGVFVIAAKPKYEKLAVNTFKNDDSQCNASPAVDGNKLFLRTDHALYCIE